MSGKSSEQLAASSESKMEADKNQDAGRKRSREEISITEDQKPVELEAANSLATDEQTSKSPRIQDAEEAAKSAMDKVQQKMIAAKLPLSETGGRLVFGRGKVYKPSILIIGEAPGEVEDATGLPFVGAAGKKLDQLLSSNGLSSNDIYISNVLKYRPPGNRDPKPEEVEKHAPYLLEQIKILQPKLICPVGNWATKFVLSGFDPKRMSKIEGITQLRGKRTMVNITQGGSTSQYINVIPALHPASALHDERKLNAVNEDFRNIAAFVKSDEFNNVPALSMLSTKEAQRIQSFAPPIPQRTLTSFFSKSK